MRDVYTCTMMRMMDDGCCEEECCFDGSLVGRCGIINVYKFHSFTLRVCVNACVLFWDNGRTETNETTNGNAKR